MIQEIAPALLGTVVGWMLYYFMRKYKIFSPQTLGATITAFLGGELLSVLHKASGGTTSIDLWYFLGVGIGFFAYAIYVGALSILYLRGKIRSPKKLEIAAGCGVNGFSSNNITDLEELETMIEFEDTLKKWIVKKISDKELKNALRELNYSKSDYYKHKRDNEFKISDPILKKFETKGFVSLLK